MNDDELYEQRLQRLHEVAELPVQDEVARRLRAALADALQAIDRLSEDRDAVQRLAEMNVSHHELAHRAASDHRDELRAMLDSHALPGEARSRLDRARARAARRARVRGVQQHPGAWYRLRRQADRRPRGDVSGMSDNDRVPSDTLVHVRCARCDELFVRQLGDEDGQRHRTYTPRCDRLGLTAPERVPSDAEKMRQQYDDFYGDQLAPLSPAFATAVAVSLACELDRQREPAT